MKKRFLLVAALCAAMNLNGFAQENLAEGKTASASSNADIAKASIDGNDKTRWEVSGEAADEVTNDNNFWYSVDFGEPTEFNTIQILWENNNVKKFNILTSDNGTDWNVVYTSPDEENAGTKTYKIGDQNARYVKIKATELNGNPYFSFWEFRVKNLKTTPTLTTVKTSKSIVKVNDTFTVTAFDQFDENFGNVDITTSDNAEKQPDGSFLAKSEGEITIRVKEIGSGNTITAKVNAYIPTLTSVSVSPVFVVTNTDTELTVGGKDQYGEDMSGLTWTIDNGSQTNNSINVKNNGNVKLTVKDTNNNEVTTTVYALSEGAKDPDFTQGTDTWIFQNSINEVPKSDAGWNWQYEKYSEFSIGENKMFMVNKAGTFGIKNENLDATKEYKTLNFDIFPDKDVTNAHITWEGSGLADIPVKELKAGEWNHVSLDISGATKLTGWIQIYLAQGDARPNILLDNVYVSRGDIKLDDPVLTSVTAPEFVQTGTEFTIDIKDQYDRDMTENVTVEGEGVKAVEGKTNTFVINNITKAGKVDLTIKSNGVTLNASTFAIEKAPDTKLQSDDYVYFENSDEGLHYYQTGWEGGYEAHKTLTFGDDNVIFASKVKTFGFMKNVEDGKYSYINFAIMPTKDLSGRKLKLQNWKNGGQMEVDMPDLKGGEWNKVSLNISGANTINAEKNYIKFSIVDESAASSDVDIFLDNIYLSKAINITEETNEKGFYAVNGYAKSVDKVNALLQDENATAYDLTGLEFEDSDNSHTLTPKNSNAIILVSGTVNGDDAVASANWGDTKNLVVTDGNYYFPINKIEISDALPVFNTMYISTNTHGFTYKRTLPANAFVSVYLPEGAQTTLPEGCTAYQFTQGDDDNSINLEKVESLSAKTPYIIRTADNEVEFTFDGTRDLNLQTTEEIQKVYGNVTVNGNFSYFNGDGTQFALGAPKAGDDGKTLTLHKVNGGTIVPFRAYITLGNNIAPQSVTFRIKDDTTGINDINKAETTMTGDIYSIDGKLVKKGAHSLSGLNKGVYIMNGKKYVVE